MKLGHLFAVVIAASQVAACATNDMPVPYWQSFVTADNRGNGAASDESQTRTTPDLAPSIDSTPLDQDVASRTIPSIGNRSTTRPGSGSHEAGPSGPDINVTLPAQSIPSFINTVFGEILEQPFSLGPEVSERREIISLRSVRDMAPATFLALVEEALKDYGLAVTHENGLYRVIALDELRSQMPQFIRSRTQAGVPTGLRPVVQFVELTAIDAADMELILRQAFPDRDQLNIRTNRGSNSLVMSGLAEDVNGALAIVEQMDELRFAGTQVVTISPRNWSATDLARDLQSILTVEGYFVAVGPTTPRAITLLPLTFTNQLMIFARERSLANYVVAMARRLDEDAFQAEAQSAHVYLVQNTSATELAGIVSAVLSGGVATSPPAGAAAAAAAAAGTPARQQVSFGNITVDEPGNRIIFFGTQDEYAQAYNLLRQLDTPLPEVMIEVTIAEVTLTGNTSYGLDAIFDTETAARFTANLNSTDGLTGVINTGQVNLSASATSGNNQINILSTPRIITRSGAVGRVQIGTDVPIITSQRAAGSQSQGSTDILQTVQYRSTGIILSVTPLVYSGNRIDLEISQEVSSAESNENEAIASPVISNRSMTSELSLQDGQTAVLGGLIETRFTRGNSGIPFIKDIPYLGVPFRSETFSSTRTMLVILVTPYILDTERNRQQAVVGMINALNDGFYNQLSASSTLRPPTEPMQIRARNQAASGE